MTRLPGLFNRYRLGDKLGSGSMGEVYRAEDRLSGGHVALKRLTASAAQWHLATSTTDTEHLRLSMAREFQALASMRHPNVITVTDYGFDPEGQPYIIMELIDNARTITEAAAKQTPEHQVDLMMQMLRALTYMHRRGVIHRDLKPANVLVTPDGQVKVLDFGLALANKQERNELEGTSGTLAYMAPEVLGGQPASAAGDLYAVGVIAFEMFSGRHPFDIHDPGRLIDQILYAVPDTRTVDMHQGVGLVIERLMAKFPEDRYTDAAEVIEALYEALDKPQPPETEAVRESFLRAAAFVGREDELRALATALNAAKSGKGGGWLVGGESGVGKSRLLDELRTQALVAGAAVLRGQAVQEGAMSYQPWREPLRLMAAVTEIDDLDAGVLKRLVPDIGDLLERPILDAPELAGEVGEMRLFTAVAGLLKRQPGTVVLLIEDLHWALDEDLRLLGWLAEQAATMPLLLVGTYRSDEQPGLPERLSHFKALKLERLNDAAVSDLAGSMLGTAGRSPQVVALLQRETEGNLFFLVEVARALAEGAGSIEQINPAKLPEKVLSGGVASMLERRLSRVPVVAWPLLKQAAVFGRQIDERLMLASLGETKSPDRVLADWLAACAGVAVLSAQEGRWQFAHDKLRAAILEKLTPEERMRMHRLAAEAIEKVTMIGQEYYAALAYHWAQAGDAERELLYSSVAGTQALAVNAYIEAARWLTRTLELAQIHTPDMVIDLRARLAEAAWGMSDLDRAEALYNENLAATRASGDEAAVAASLMGLGVVADAHGNYAQAQTHFEASLALARAQKNQEGIAQGIEKLAQIHYRLGNYEDAVALAKDALSLYTTVNSLAGKADTLKLLGTVSAIRGDIPTARGYYTDSLALYRQVGQKRGISALYNNLGLLATREGDQDAARLAFHDSLELKREIGDRRGMGGTLNNLAILAYNRGDYLENRRLLEEAIVLGNSLNDKQLVADASLNLGRTLITLGLHEAAHTILAESLTLNRELGDTLGVALTLLNQGRLALEKGENAASKALLFEALALARGQDNPAMVLNTLVELGWWTLRANHDAPFAVALAAFSLRDDHLEADYRAEAKRLGREAQQDLTPEAVTAAQERYVDAPYEKVYQDLGV